MVGKKYLTEFVLLCLPVFEILDHNEATSQNVQSNGTKNLRECTLPPHPADGQWYFENQPSNFSGLQVPLNSILKIQCDKTFSLEGCPMTVCINGQWFPPIGQCAQTCRSINTTSTLSVKCIYKGQENLNCVEPKEGTLAQFKCKSFYEDTRLSKPKAICIGGRWSSKIPECTPICGRAALRKRPTLIIRGKNTRKGEFPWQVALYADSDKTLICGGSLLSERVVLTAAHCITDSDGNISPKEDFVIVAGKYFRQFDHSGDSKHRQVSKIENMFISDEYQGDEMHYVGDIAIIITKKFLTFSSRVQPVCIDWSRVYENELIDSEDERGYVSGWGYTRQNSKPANELKSLRVPSISRKNCRNFLPDEYKRFMTSDKFCAGYRSNGTSVCGGDSGGGLVFKRDGRFFIAGIVSLAPLADSEEGGCDSQQYSLYTLVSKYTDNLILKSLAQFKPLKEDDGGGQVHGWGYGHGHGGGHGHGHGGGYGHGHYGGYGNKPVTTEGCWLPELKDHPYRYIVLSGPKNISSDSVSLYVPFNTTIKINCTKKYKLDGPDISVCTSNGWSTSLFTACKKKTTCPSLYSSTKIEFSCTLKDTETECDDNPLVDTVAKFECTPFHEFSTTDPEPSVCLQRGLKGLWSFFPECVPACGQISSISNTNSPWRVAIYDYTTKKLLCEGSLITTRIIVTAAQCITDTKNRLRFKEDFIVAVGKTHPDYNYPDADAQFSKLQEVVVQDSYKGDAGNYQSDIAVIVAEKSFIMSSSVQLVCVDWSSSMVPPNNKEAFVNSWRSNVSTYQKLGISGQECFDSDKEEFEEYYTADKFCGRFIDANNSVCKSDAGAGLVVKQNSKYYLVGVSTLTADVEMCDNQQYGVFTRIDSYMDRFILQTERRYKY